MHRPMVLVPIKVEHRIDAIRNELADMFLDAGDQFVQTLVQASIGKVVLRDGGYAKRLKRGTRFGRTVEPGWTAFAAVRKYDRVNGNPARAELRERRAAAELQIVGMSAQCQYGFNHIHTGQLGRGPLTPGFDCIRFGAMH